MSRFSVLVLVASAVAGIAPAARAAGRRSVVVEVSPADWRGEAVSRALTADLADDRLAPRAAPACAGPCSDAALRSAGVELIVRATLTNAGDGRLGYELRALWPGAPAPVRGSLALSGHDRAELAALLRDRLHRLARATTDEDGHDGGATTGSAAGDAATSTGATSTSTAPATGSASTGTAPATDAPATGKAPATDAPAPRVAPATGAEPSTIATASSVAPPRGFPGAGAIALLLLLVIAVLATPLAYGAVRTRRLVARAAMRRTLVGVAGFAALALVIAATGLGRGDGALFAAGGIAWGALVAVTVPVVLPPLTGLGRIDYRELAPVLAAWCRLVVLRTFALAALYAPIAIALVVAPLEAVSDALGAAGSAPRLALALPLGLLIARQWVRLLIAVLAERLDSALLEPADAATWHTAVRGYLVGYLQRNGLAVDGDLLDRITMLPATGDRVCVYGGGATHARIAIPRRMLELALAPWGRPHDYAAPRVSTLHWTEWNAGLVMGTEAGSPSATRAQRQPRETTTEGDPSAHAREPLGEPPTLIGIVEPIALDPRKSYRPHDDPAWLDWDAGEDYDGTDAGDRDFLFGALIHAIALIQRHGDRPSTFALALARTKLTAPLGALFARIASAGGDEHAAIQGARHHLIQYLGWQAWQREDRLTARAYAPELAAMSRRLIAERANAPAGPDGARARARLARLAPFVDDTEVRTRWRALAIAGAVVACASVAAVAVADAVRYHASYRDRMKSQMDPMEKPDHGKD